LYFPNHFTIQLIFLPYFPYHFTFQLAFLPCCPYLITIRLSFLPYFPEQGFSIYSPTKGKQIISVYKFKYIYFPAKGK
jgi:hypothetical protein